MSGPSWDIEGGSPGPAAPGRFPARTMATAPDFVAEWRPAHAS